MVAKLLAHMKPPVETARARRPAAPGYYELEVAALPTEPPVTYYVQLPPEYDPYRRYPAIVTLHGAGTHAPSSRSTGGRATGRRTARAGARPPATATSSIAPEWTAEHQKEYGYSGPRARRRAGLAPRRLPAVLHRHRPRVPLRPFHRRRRGLGHRPGPSRSLGRRDPHRRPSPTATATATGRTPSYCRSTSSTASWTAAR